MNDSAAEHAVERTKEMVEANPDAFVCAAAGDSKFDTTVGGDPRAAAACIGVLMHAVSRKANVSIVDVSEEATRVAFDAAQSDGMVYQDREFDGDE